MTGLTAPHKLMGSGNSCPQLMTNVADTHQYGVHITNSAGCVVYRRSLATGAVDASFDLSTISGNPLDLPLDSETDAHFTMSLGIDADDVLHVSGNQHDAPPNHRYVTAPAASFTTAANWTHHGTDFDSLGTNGQGMYTYNIFDRTSDGTLLWFLSQSSPRPVASHRDWLGFKRVSGAWEPIISPGRFGVTTGPATEGKPERIYIHGVECHPRLGLSDRVYVCGIWRMEFADGDTQLDPWMLYSDDLTTWRNMDGTVHTMPLTFPDRAGATITSNTAYRYMQLGVDVDADEQPSIILRNGISTDPEAFEVWTWLGTSWSNSAIVPLVGQTRVVAIRDAIYLRHVITGRSGLKNWNTGNAFRIGGPMTLGSQQPNHDPIRLRRHGIYSTCIGDGSTPVVYEFGNGARAGI